MDDPDLSATARGGPIEREASSASARPLLAALFLLCLLLMATLPLRLREQLGGIRRLVLALDFRAFYTAGLMLRDGVREGFYDVATQYRYQSGFAPEVSEPTGLMLFLNPPFTALPLALLARLPLVPAYAIWAGANLLLLAFMTRRLLDVLPAPSLSAKSIVLVMSLSFMPVWVAAMHGQFSFLFVLSLLGSWRALRAGRDLPAGLWLGLLLVKPQFVPVPALVLAWRRRWRALAGMALAGAILLVVSWLAVGGKGLEGYARLLHDASRLGEGYTIRPKLMYCWRGFLHLRMDTNDPADVRVAWLAGVVAGVGILLWAWRGNWAPRSARFDLQWSLLAIVTLLVSPHANIHDLSVLVVFGALVARHLLGRGKEGGMEGLLAALPILGWTLFWPNQIGTPGGMRLAVLFMWLAAFVLFLASSPSSHRIPADPQPRPGTEAG